MLLVVLGHFGAAVFPSYLIKLANSRSDPKAFWATIRKLQLRTSSPSVLSDGSAAATSDLDKANLFNQYFASCFNPTCVSPSYSSLDTEDVDFMDSLDVVLAEVANLLRRTKAHCASGPDGIPAWMLRSFLQTLSLHQLPPCLSCLFDLYQPVEGVPCCPNSQGIFKTRCQLLSTNFLIAYHQQVSGGSH